MEPAGSFALKICMGVVFYRCQKNTCNADVKDPNLVPEAKFEWKKLQGTTTMDQELTLAAIRTAGWMPRADLSKMLQGLPLPLEAEKIDLEVALDLNAADLQDAILVQATAVAQSTQMVLRANTSEVSLGVSVKIWEAFGKLWFLQRKTGRIFIFLLVENSGQKSSRCSGGIGGNEAFTFDGKIFQKSNFLHKVLQKPDLLDKFLDLASEHNVTQIFDIFPNASCLPQTKYIDSSCFSFPTIFIMLPLHICRRIETLCHVVSVDSLTKKFSL